MSVMYVFLHPVGPPNPLTAKVLNRIFHLNLYLSDAILQMSESSDLTKWRSMIFLLFNPLTAKLFNLNFHPRAYFSPNPKKHILASCPAHNVVPQHFRC